MGIKLLILIGILHPILFPLGTYGKEPDDLKKFRKRLSASEKSKWEKPLILGPSNP